MGVKVVKDRDHLSLDTHHFSRKGRRQLLCVILGKGGWGGGGKVENEWGSMPSLHLQGEPLLGTEGETQVC